MVVAATVAACPVVVKTATEGEALEGEALEGEALEREALVERVVVERRVAEERAVANMGKVRSVEATRVMVVVATVVACAVVE